jgi:hypothetical protein
MDWLILQLATVAMLAPAYWRYKRDVMRREFGTRCVPNKKAACFSTRRFAHLSTRFATQYDFPRLTVWPSNLSAISGNRHSKNDIRVLVGHKDFSPTQD